MPAGWRHCQPRGNEAGPLQSLPVRHIAYKSSAPFIYRPMVVRSPGSQNLGLVVASVGGMWSRNQIQTIKLPLTLALLLFVVGCQSRASASSTGSTPPPPSVSVLDVELGDAPIYRDY